MHVTYDPAATGGSALPDDDGTSAAAAAAAAAAQGDAAPADDIMDAFTQGVEEARQQEAGEDAPPPADPAAPPAEGDPPPAGDPPQAGATDGQPTDQQQPPAEPSAVEKEIKELGITNERTQARFRELIGRAAEAERLAPIVERAKQWEETIESTGAKPEQLGQALNYLAAVNSGDPNALRQAHQFLSTELEWLSKQLGLPAPGYDPLSDFPDLAEQVRNGDTTRELAHEVAARRRAEALQAQRNERVQQSTQQQEQEAAARTTALREVATLGQQLRASDPKFAAKYDMIKPMVAVIQETLPPAQWAAAIQKAYSAVQLPAAPPPPPTPNPARPSGVALAPDAAADPFAFGVEEARARGL